MKIRIERTDGDLEIIELKGPITLRPVGSYTYLDDTGGGMSWQVDEHGRLAGWEIDADMTGKTPAEMKAVMEDIQASRVVVGRKSKPKH